MASKPDLIHGAAIRDAHPQLSLLGEVGQISVLAYPAVLMVGMIRLHNR
jgi:hypothetical protein